MQNLTWIRALGAILRHSHGGVRTLCCPPFPISVFRPCSGAAAAVTFGCGFLHHLVTDKNTFVSFWSKEMPQQNIFNILIKEQMHLEVLFNLIWPNQHPTNEPFFTKHLHLPLFHHKIMFIATFTSRVFLVWTNQPKLELCIHLNIWVKCWAVFSKSVVFGRW